MPSSFAHAAAGAALTSVVAHAPNRRLLIAAAVCAAFPDVDALGRPFGNLSYEGAFGGHRGFTHSILFAILAGAVTAWIFRRDTLAARDAQFRLWLAFAVAIASHGVLDALSTIGNGVAFWAPFSWTHYEFVWQPLGELGPGPRGPMRLFALVANELLWVGLPALVVVGVGRMLRRGPRDRVAETPAEHYAVTKYSSGRLVNPSRARYEKNAPGFFYAVGGCLACGAPEHEAPELMSTLDDDNWETYFVRQPQTPEEVEHACRAIEVCCLATLRYGGHDPAVIRRLGNRPEYCDHLLPGGLVRMPWETDAQWLKVQQELREPKRWWQFWRS